MFIDDIIVSDKTTPEHDKRTNQLLKALKTASLKVKKKLKCSLIQKPIKYFGNEIDGKSLHTSKNTYL